MLRHATATLLVMFVACAIRPAHAESALQGKWEGAGSDAGWSMTFDGETWYASSGDTWYSGDFVIDPVQSPAWIDLIIRDCSSCRFLDRTSLGIYELQDDSLTVAGPEPGKPRARRFKDDSNQLLKMVRAEK